MAYSVTLVNFGDASQEAIHAAEARFRSELDALLGERVVLTLNALRAVSGANARRPTKVELALIAAWQKAYDLAKDVGLRGLCTGKAYFEVRLL